MLNEAFIIFVENFKCIGREVHIKIDDIIILIGQNNVGKSTILDAYEKFAALGKEKVLDISHFHNEDVSKPVIMTGVFTDITVEDETAIGKNGSTMIQFMVSVLSSDGYGMHPVSRLKRGI